LKKVKYKINVFYKNTKVIKYKKVNIDVKMMKTPYKISINMI
jgi:hypothetical protein